MGADNVKTSFGTPGKAFQVQLLLGVALDWAVEEALREGEEGAAVAAAFIDALEAEQVEAVDALIELHDGVPAPISLLPLSPPTAAEGNAADGAAPDPVSMNTPVLTLVMHRRDPRPWSTVGWLTCHQRRSSPQQQRGDPGRQHLRDTVQPCPSTSPSPRRLAGGLGRGEGTGAGVPNRRPPQRLWPSPARSSPCAIEEAAPNQGGKGASSPF
ncbi:Protein translocase subunit [Frankliniella fusca]|uniref:Protein translocase subunit n=1 Tax=Frankliniella fusca TaxID=407009 RepID=A0AAE1HNK3_9NEOP|nr:Protein translocase subunit [Frankliniella fusca]